jgi:transcriptional regulator with XRE-family HTH domain
MYIIISTMARTPFADREICRELCGQLQEYFAQRKTLRKAKLARDLGISRGALYRYLKGKSSPSPELLAKFLDLPGISLTLAGRRISAEELRPVQQPTGPEAVQYALPFDVPVYVESEAQKVTVGIIRKSPGSANTLEFTVEIKLARGGM